MNNQPVELGVCEETHLRAIAVHGVVTETFGASIDDKFVSKRYLETRADVAFGETIRAK